MSHAPPIITHPPVLRQDWKILAWIAFKQSKLPDLDACPAPNHPPIDFVAQPTTHSLLSFEAQIKKSRRWFWDTNHQTGATGFESQTRKPSTLFLRLNQETRAPHLLVYGTDRTRRHPTSRSFGHRVPDLWLIIPDHLHQVSYSCLDPRRCMPCCWCSLNIDFMCQHIK
jgi:hypothetical protein